MATPSKRPAHIHPAMRVVMRLPETDAATDPWTGAPITSGRNFADESAIDENVGLAPPEGKTSAELLDEDRMPLKVDPFVEQPAESPLKVQFSLRDLLILTTMAGVGLTGARLLPPAPFACLVGVMAFAALWITSQWGTRNSWARIGVWSLLLVYVIAAAAAIVRA